MKRWLPVIVSGGLVIGFVSGCCCGHRQSGIISQQVPPATFCPPGGTAVPGGIPAPPPGALTSPPPGAITSPPPGAFTAPPSGSSMPPPPPAFPGTQPNASNFGPASPTQDNWRPVEGRQVQPYAQAPRYSPPPTVAPPIVNAQPQTPREPPLARIQLNPPEPIQEQNPSAATVQPPEPDPPMPSNPSPSPAQEPPPLAPEPAPLAREPAPSKGFAFPVGIPQFSVVKEGVANGLRPSLDEGLDWLQKQGYRTVLYVRRPNDADSADRSQVEKRGMKFLTLEVTPDSLTETTVTDFIGIVNESANRPIFVYDRDGSLAGGLWYLAFRRDNASDDVARVRAGSLGFREDRDDAHREMWMAVQKLLNQ